MQLGAPVGCLDSFLTDSIMSPYVRKPAGTDALWLISDSECFSRAILIDLL